MEMKVLCHHHHQHHHPRKRALGTVTLPRKDLKSRTPPQKSQNRRNGPSRIHHNNRNESPSSCCRERRSKAVRSAPLQRMVTDDNKPATHNGRLEPFFSSKYPIGPNPSRTRCILGVATIVQWGWTLTDQHLGRNHCKTAIFG
jgi:hypothetical protein